MSGRETPEPATEREQRERRVRRDRIFGEVLPESTQDDVDDRPGEGTQDEDAWLRRQVPPHHG